MKKIALLFCILASTIGAKAQNYKFPVDTLIKTGTLKRRLNVVILPDGYTAAEMTKFKTDATNFITYFLQISPFDKYKSYFNFFTINVPSAESGATHAGNADDENTSGNQPVETKNTYFGSIFDTGKIHRLVTITKYSNLTNVMATNFPSYDILFVMTNSIYYGGSGGTIASFTTHVSSSEIGMHEMGHSFVGLADEYWAGDNYASEKLNMSADKNPATNRWKNWLNVAGIGIYPHDYPAQNWYKPSKDICRMQYLGIPYCAVCREGFVEKILGLISPIESQLPATTSAILTETATTFKVGLLKPQPNSLQVEWLLDGKSISTQEQIQLSANDMPNKTAKLVATVYDSTYFSRNTSRKLKPNTIEWQLSRIDLFRISANKAVICSGDSVVLTSFGCTGNISWSNNMKGNAITVKPTATINYSAICNNSLASFKDSVGITVTPTPVAVANNKGPYTETQTIELFSSGGDSYEWKGSNGFTSTDQNPTLPNSKVVNSGLYTVTIRRNNCQNTATTTVNVNALLVTVSEISPQTVCQNGQISLTFMTNLPTGANNNIAIQLSDNQGNNFKSIPTSINGNTLKGTIPITVTAGTGYKVRVVIGNSENQGVASPTTLTLKPLATAQFGTKETTIQPFQTAEAKVLLSGEPPFKLKISNGQSFDIADSITILKFNPTQTTDYQLTSVSNACGEGIVGTAAFKVIVIPILGVELLDDTIEVYPNPTEHAITVTLKKIFTGKTTIQLIDNQGKTLFRQETQEAKTTINLQSIPAGSYILRVQQGDKISGKKIVKY